MLRHSPPPKMRRLSLVSSHVGQKRSQSQQQEVVAAVCGGGGSTPHETRAGAAFSEVVATLQSYFDGAHNVQPERTRAIWHEEVASLRGVGRDGELAGLEPTEYFELIASGGCGSSDVAVLAADRIVSVEFSSARTALAKVEVSNPLDARGQAELYTDFITLVCIRGRGWTVVSKLFADRPLGTLAYSEPGTTAVDDATHAEIASALSCYFEGQRSGAGSSAIMREVFHNSALLRGPVMECDAAQHPTLGVGDLRVLTAEQFFAMLDSADFPTWTDAGLNKIVKIDKSGPRTACATVQIQLGGLLWTDFLSLAKLGGADEEQRWMIVHKTFVPSAIE